MSLNRRELKNNAYYLVQSNEHGVLALRELSKSEYQQATEASFKLHQYHYHKRRELEVRLNLDDFFERYNHYEMKAITQGYTDKNEFFDRAYVDMNRVLTNFLAAFKLFVDNLESYVKKEYKETSSEYKQLKKTIRHEFNSKFEYRLMYFLRNYSQHKGFPIGSVGMDHEVDPHTSEIQSVFKLNFDKEKLLSDDRKNLKHIELDLTLFNDSFPVLPQMVKIKKSLDVVINSFTNIEMNSIVNHSNILLKHLGSSEGDGQLGFAKFKSSTNGNGSFDSKEIPMNILRQIYRDIEGKDPTF